MPSLLVKLIQMRFFSIGLVVFVFGFLVLKNWEFIGNHIIDKEKGEWFWGIHADGSKIQKDKAGPWKCCYHNGRACLELINRINKTK